MTELTKMERLILNGIRNNRGSYKELAKDIYKTDLDKSIENSIKVTVHRIRAKGYKIYAIDNWGYKEETNEQVK